MVQRAIVLGVVALALLPVALAAAQETERPTREEYVSEADPICRVHYRKSFRLLADAGDAAGAGKIHRAGELLVRAYRHGARANRELRELEPPPADAELIGVWLDKNRRAMKLGIESGQTLKEGNADEGRRLQRRAARKARKANEKVAGFGFTHCV
jgi:hypothetical protein